MPPAGRFPECGSPPLCATPAWRSLPPKCSKSTCFRKSLNTFGTLAPAFCEGRGREHFLVLLLLLTQISGPPFSPLPPGSGGVPGVCASRLLQGRTPDGWPQRAPGPSLQQLRDRVDHQGAGRHAPLWTAHPGRVNGATDRGREGGMYSGGGGEGPCGAPHPFNKLTTKSNPCLERETPLESSCSYCGLLTIQHYCYFVYFRLFALGLF